MDFLTHQPGPSLYPRRSHFIAKLRVIDFEFRWSLGKANDGRINSTTDDTHQDTAKDKSNNQPNSVKSSYG